MNKIQGQGNCLSTHEVKVQDFSTTKQSYCTNTSRQLSGLEMSIYNGHLPDFSARIDI
jgi:hypothetical protein